MKVKITYENGPTGLWAKGFTEQFGVEYACGSSFQECRKRLINKLTERKNALPLIIPEPEEVEI